MLPSEKQIKNRVRSHLRVALLRQNVVEARVKRLLEANEAQDLPADIEAAISSFVSSVDSDIDNLEMIDPKKDDKKLKESWLVTSYGLVVSASGIAKILGHLAKGTAKILKALGANVDPEKEGQTFFNASHSIHHFYIGMLKKLAVKMGFKGHKQDVAANVMFGVLLGVAAASTGTELYNALTNSKAIHAMGEAVMSGVKAAEGTKISTDIFSIFEMAAAEVPELVGLIPEIEEAAEEVLATAASTAVA